MKKIFIYMCVSTAFLTGTIFTGCQSSDTDVRDAKEDLVKAKKDANEAANKAEWNVFKSEAEVKIKANELRIAEFREKMKNAGKAVSDLSAKRIEELEQKNKDLKTKLENFEKNQGNWDTFKREFNNDADALGKAFTNLTVDNKK